MVKFTPKKGKATTTWPIVLTHNPDARTDDMYADAFIGPIGEGAWKASIKDRDVVIQVQVDPIRYDPDEFLRTFPHVNPESALLGTFAAQGRATMGENEGHPDLIVDKERYTMGFDIEQNFFSRTGAMGVFEFRSATGSRYIHFTVRRIRTHQRMGWQQSTYAVASAQLAIQSNEPLVPVQYGVHHPVRYQNH
jgi:hypothetical protein